MRWTSRLVAIGAKIKTPLGLAGVVIIVFYALINQILKLDIFSNIGSSATFQLIDSLLTYLFYLALVSVALAIVAYLAALRMRLQPSPRRSRLELVDANLDRDSSDYVTDGGDPTAVIRHRSRAKQTDGAPRKEND